MSPLDRSASAVSDPALPLLNAAEAAPVAPAPWRSLGQLQGTSQFQEFVRHEFPSEALGFAPDGLSRRPFLKWMAASIGLMGMAAGCRRPEIEILPYATMPEHVIPGLPNFYATTIPRPSGGFPILVESHEGRPTKIEGNPQHPASLGKSDLHAQASILELYDPDRSRVPLKGGRESNWAEFDEFAATHFAAALKEGGAGLRILSEPVHSPSLRLLKAHLAKEAPEAVWHEYAPLSAENSRAGTALLFGQPFRPQYQLEGAKVILALDADFLGSDPDSLRHVRGFIQGRHIDAGTAAKPAALQMNRLYVVEPTPTVTGGMADHRLPLPGSQVADYLFSLAEALQALAPLGAAAESLQPLLAGKRTAAIPVEWITDVAADLRAAGGHGLVIPGDRQPPLVHALAHLINLQLSLEHVTYLPLAETPAASLAELTEAIGRGTVETLLILGGNPVYNAPADADFAGGLRKTPTTIRLGMHVDETSQLCDWHLPESHFLESWGDVETTDGHYSPVQPLIAPLSDTRSALQLLAGLFGYEKKEPYEIIQQAFAARAAAVAEPITFQRWLHSGILPGSETAAAKVQVNRKPASESLQQALENHAPSRIDGKNFELALQADTSVLDGRFANHPWLQECPDPVTKLVWDNAALLSHDLAKSLAVEPGDHVTLTVGDRTLEIPAFIQPGQAPQTVTVALGYGRTAAGSIGTGVGADAFKLRTTANPYFSAGLKIQKTAGHRKLATTQEHYSLEGRDLLRVQTLEQYRAHPGGEPHGHETAAPAVERAPESQKSKSHEEKQAGKSTGHEVEGGGLDIVQPPPLDGEHRWGMSIDLNKCLGCNACMVACQSENNVPIVGQDEVRRGRAMHWLRIDRYYEGPIDNPQMLHQPVACVHCENAPCEAVCPVNATVHSPEGLNLQVYNRCIGTRYCSNNCPYKVRRFNWFDYNQRPLDELRLGPLSEYGMAETLQMQKNPDVTVRMRGVMEKCNYCVQRIERGKIGTKLLDPTAPKHPIPDGTVTPACAQSCPSEAIVFGDLNDPESRVSKLRHDPRTYGLLEEINTKPRTHYLTRVTNPNPRMQSAKPAAE